MTKTSCTAALAASAIVLAALAGCTSGQTGAAVTVTSPAPTQSATDTPTPTPTPSPSDTTASPTAPSPSPSTTSPSPSPTVSPTDAPTGPPAQTVEDVDWENARLPIMCGGAVELVKLRKGAGRTRDGLSVEFLDVSYGSASADRVENLAVVQLDCMGAHPGPVDAPVFRSGASGPEFLGFATMSLDRFSGKASISKHGIVVRGSGYSDKAAGCCPDLAATMTSSVAGNALVLQERDTAPIGKAKPGGECDVLAEIALQSKDLAKQTKGHPASRAAVVLSKLTTAIAAQRAQEFLDVLRSQLQRGCP